MPAITETTICNGLPLYRIEIDGTRAVTLLVAFDAGARSELPEENGMAHFLEHLVFKGGEKYSTYRDVNEAAESIGAVLNAYTSHDLVAFHITARAQYAIQAADLALFGQQSVQPWVGLRRHRFGTGKSHDQGRRHHGNRQNKYREIHQSLTLTPRRLISRPWPSALSLSRPIHG